jgi:hypothetical protein
LLDVRICAATAALGLLLVGCGAAKGTPDFVAKANAICAGANRQVEALPTQADTLRGLVASVSAEVPLAQAELTKLKALTAPSGKEAIFAKVLTNLGAELAAVQQIIKDARHSRTSAIAAIGQRMAPVANELDSEAIALGVTQCTKNVSPEGSS